MKPSEKETTLEGVLIAVDWGPSGEVLGMALAAYNDKEYHIDSICSGEHRLEDCLRKRVRLRALVGDDHRVRVTHIELLEGHDDRREAASGAGIPSVAAE